MRIFSLNSDIFIFTHFCVIRTLGLHIRSVEENSRSEREGIFKEDECIVQINDVELMDKSFAQ